MAKQDLGKKRRCASCGMKFYDFNKAKIECPSCQTEFNPDQLLKSRRGKSAKSTAAATDAASEDIVHDELLADDNDDDSDDLDSDALGGDEPLVDIAQSDENGDDDTAVLDDNVDGDFIDDIDSETNEEA